MFITDVCAINNRESVWGGFGAKGCTGIAIVKRSRPRFRLDRHRMRCQPVSFFAMADASSDSEEEGMASTNGCDHRLSQKASVQVSVRDQQRLRDFVKEQDGNVYIRDGWLQNGFTSEEEVNGHVEPDHREGPATKRKTTDEPVADQEHEKGDGSGDDADADDEDDDVPYEPTPPKRRLKIFVDS